MTTIEHLAAGDTPSLKPRSDWPISAGPWKCAGRTDGKGDVVRLENGMFQKRICLVSVTDARFIASCNSDTPLVEKAWDIYELLMAEDKWHEECGYKECADEYKPRALYWLTWLDTGGFLNWAGKAAPCS